MKKRARRTILERTLAELSSLLLELLDGTLVDTTALVDQVCEAGCERRRLGSMTMAGHDLRPVVVDFPESTCPMTTTLT